MTPPFMNTDYSSEVGTIKDYRERAPFCCAGRRTSAGYEAERKREGERTQKRQGHFPAPRGGNLNLLFFLLRSPPTTLLLPFFYYTPDRIFSADTGD